ncbi:MAG: TSUP family transporter [Clostridia bacterium]|nr:TSUP family transporter [Clostridia bacterium]
MKQNKAKILIKNKVKKLSQKNKKYFKSEYIFLPYKQRRRNKKQNHKLSLFLAGSLMGFLNGFFGGGGGMVCVPLLQKCLKLDAKHSHATAILIIFPLSLISAFIYVLNGYITSLPLVAVGGGVVLGGVLGAFALKFLPPKAVRIIFAVIMFAGGIKLII